MEGKLLTMKEAAAILRCHVETLRLEIRKGNLAAGRVGRDYRISLKRLSEYWEKRGGERLVEAESRQEVEKDDLDHTFRQVCAAQGEDPDQVIKNLMAEHVKKAREPDRKGEPESNSEIQKAVKRRKEQARVKLDPEE